LLIAAAAVGLAPTPRSPAADGPASDGPAFNDQVPPPQVSRAQASRNPHPIGRSTVDLPDRDASVTNGPVAAGAASGQASEGQARLIPGAARVPVNNSPQIQLGAAGQMIGFSNSDGSGSQTITLIDTSKSWMAVYHVGRSGKIRLVSSRPLDADFSLQLNATSPLPEEIRALGGR